MNKEGCETSGQALAKYVCAAIGGFFLGVLLVGLYFMPPKDSGQLAAWVQAIGSVGTIAAAIYVLYEQHENSLSFEEKKTAREGQRLLRALKSELEVRWMQYMQLVGRDIQNGKLKKLGAFEWKTPGNPFQVYMGNLSKLGAIHCDKTREKVVEVYALMEGLLLTSTHAQRAVGNSKRG